MNLNIYENFFEVNLNKPYAKFVFLCSLPFFLAGLDMLFFHFVIPSAKPKDIKGYIVGGLFLLIAGGIGLISGLKNTLKPSTLFIANNKGIFLYTKPFSSKADFIPWPDILDIREGKISNPQDHMPVGKSTFPALMIVLTPESQLPSEKITGGAALIEWSNKSIKILASQLSIELKTSILKLQELKQQSNK